LGTQNLGNYRNNITRLKVLSRAGQAITKRLNRYKDMDERKEERKKDKSFIQIKELYKKKNK
jgi:hypothetical protein